MTSMRRRYVASTSLRRHVPAANLAPPNILNAYSTPMNIESLNTSCRLYYKSVTELVPILLISFDEKELWKVSIYIECSFIYFE